MNKNENKRYERLSAKSKGQLIIESENVLQEMQQKFENTIPGMEYFYDVAKQYAGGQLKNPERKKYIATNCIQVPIELIYAANALPIRICSGAYSMSQAGAGLLPAKSCSLVNATLGTIYTNSFPLAQKPLTIITPTTCDQKKKLSEIPSGIDIPFYTLEMPPSKDSEEAQEYWYRSVKKLKGELERITGNRITRSKLKKAIIKVAQAQRAFRHFHQLRKEEAVIRGTDAILIANTFFYDNIDTWTSHLVSLNAELEMRKSRDHNGSESRYPRILLTGSPSIFPNLKLPIMIEKMGGSIVADEFCSSNRLLYDTVAVDEWNMYDMVPALSDRYLKACTCPCFTPNNDRERKILAYIKDFKVDGVVYQSFSGCQLYELESLRISAVLEKENVPMLYVETDYSPDDKGQLATRTEAFIESIKNNL